MRKGFLAVTAGHFGRASWCAFGILVNLIVLSVAFSLQRWPYFENHPERFVWASLIAFLAMILSPVFGMARKRNQYVLYVALWGATITVVVLIAGYMSFYLYVKHDNDLQTRYQPILALAPVISGLMLAAVGWFIHYQKTAKDARTAAAFKIIMDTRTSSEFLRFQRELRIVYPSGCPIPEGDCIYFSNTTKSEEETKLQLAKETDDARKATLTLEIAKLRAIDAMKYLLNSYEFISQAIRAGDLDDHLLYETISQSVVEIYDRGKVYIDHITAQEPLSLQHLTYQVHVWRQQLKQEEADLLASRSDSPNGPGRSRRRFRRS